METRYRWDSAELTTLKSHVTMAYTALEVTAGKVAALVSDMESDTTWSGSHKKEFMAWMDLVRQLHEALAAEVIGRAAEAELGEFLGDWASFYVDSELFGSLRGV